MIRRIIHIDEDKCTGCGLCAAACHEGAIAMVDGKAKLMREDYCDGLGDCLPACPVDAISFVEREAPAYNEAAVLESRRQKAHSGGGCPGHTLHSFRTAPAAAVSGGSQLAQWPCQLRLVPVNAPYFQNADLLIAADCSAYAYADFHSGFMAGKITLIGCPKLDEGDYTEKLTVLLRSNGIRSVTVTRMEVPCCGGLERAVRAALANAGKDIPLEVVTFSLNGSILSRKA